jgi:hypothetical protein
MRSILLALAFAGCAGTATIAPPPFTAEQIHGATAPGRTYRFEIANAGQPPVIRQVRFVEVTADNALVESTMESTSGERLGEPERKTETWAGFVAHAAWPKDATTISEEPIEVPAGKFDAVLYTVREDGGITRAWFAKTLPGAPVRYVIEKDGVPVMTMTLVEHRAGGAT